MRVSLYVYVCMCVCACVQEKAANQNPVGDPNKNSIFSSRNNNNNNNNMRHRQLEIIENV